MAKRSQLTGRAAEERPAVNELAHLASVTPAWAVDNGPKVGTRRERREAARKARKTHESLVGPLRKAAE